MKFKDKRVQEYSLGVQDKLIKLIEDKECIDNIEEENKENETYSNILI